MTFQYDNRLIVARAGDFVWGNRGVIHNFTGTSIEPAKMLLIATPSSFARSFASWPGRWWTRAHLRP